MTNPPRRHLQTVPIPPTRTCGQNLGITSRDVISGLIQSLGQAFGNVTLDQNVNYNVQAIVHCGSCEQVATTDLLADTEGFGSYCAEGSYGYNVTHSGLLLLPIDVDTNEIIANQKLKGSVFCAFPHNGHVLGAFGSISTRPGCLYSKCIRSGSRLWIIVQCHGRTPCRKLGGRVSGTGTSSRVLYVDSLSMYIVL